jgi:hypothetical protein
MSAQEQLAEQLIARAALNIRIALGCKGAKRHTKNKEVNPLSEP